MKMHKRITHPSMTKKKKSSVLPDAGKAANVNDIVAIPIVTPPPSDSTAIQSPGTDISDIATECDGILKEYSRGQR